MAKTYVLALHPPSDSSNQKPTINHLHSRFPDATSARLATDTLRVWCWDHRITPTFQPTLSKKAFARRNGLSLRNTLRR